MSSWGDNGGVLKEARGLYEQIEMGSINGILLSEPVLFNTGG